MIVGTDEANGKRIEIHDNRFGKRHYWAKVDGRVLLLDRSIGSASSDAFKENLVNEILRINDRFNHNPSLDEALNSGDGSYKP